LQGTIEAQFLHVVRYEDEWWDDEDGGWDEGDGWDEGW
jgi:hypothetical protein